MDGSRRHVYNPVALWVLVIVLGSVHTIAVRFSMNPDGISYLNLADLYREGDVAAAVNAYWSPLFPFLLGLFLTVTRPTPYWEAAVVHAFTFVLYIAAFLCFQFFLRVLREHQRSNAREPEGEGMRLDLSDPVGWFCAHALFLWSTLVLVGFYNVTPDMLVTAIVYAAAALSIRSRISGSIRYAALFGVVLGIGYLAKAVMFPIALLFLVASAVPTGRSRPRARTIMISVLAFAAVAAPQVVAVSRVAGRVTYAEAGRLAYAAEVNGIPHWWNGTQPGTGVAEHPVREIHSNPATYEFAVSNGHFSYPLWDLPAYWKAGVTPHFELSRQVSVTKSILKMYLDLLQIPLFALTVLFLCRLRIDVAAFAGLLIPGLGAFALYALVFAETRYLAPWVTLLFLGSAASLIFPLRNSSAVRATILSVGAYVSLTVLNQSRYSINESLKAIAGTRGDHLQFDVASGLRSAGMREGSRLAFIGYAFDGYAARLTKSQIVIQVPDAAGYWASSPAVRADIMSKFKENGVSAVITNRPPDHDLGPRWVPVGDRGYYFFVLDAGPAETGRSSLP